ADRLQILIDELKNAHNDTDHPLHLWSLVVRAAQRGEDQTAAITQAYAADGKQRASDNLASWKGMRVLVDFSRATVDDWSQDGIAFGLRPVRAGDMRFGTDPNRPFAEVFAIGAARSDPALDLVRLAPDTEGDPGKVSWCQAGRTLRTRTIT